MKTIEIIRNSVMQCIEKIEALLKRISKTEKTVEEQGNKIKDGMVSLSVMENFASSQFANFTYLYYEENGEIKSILFNDGNVDKPKIYSYVISGKPLSYRCSGDTLKVEFKNFDTSSVTNMESMFADCYSIKSLNLSNFNTSAVTIMNLMFYSCDLLTSLDVSNLDTSAVTSMYSIFFNCYSLTSIIGTHTLEEVQAGTVKAMRGLKVSISFSESPNLERASILALFYGLADLTGNTKQTISLHATAKARLTAEDIKIATDKNWDVQ